jgi:hypothetical protein
MLHGHTTLPSAYQLFISAYPRDFLARFHPFTLGYSPPFRNEIPHAVGPRICLRTIAGWVRLKNQHLAPRITEDTINRTWLEGDYQWRRKDPWKGISRHIPT